MPSASNIFTKEEAQRVISAIKEAEQNTSGEIRVHVEDNCEINPIERAVSIFQALEMHKTDSRNGVLIYLAAKEHKFAIIGDQGINDVVPENFWEDIKDQMTGMFKDGKFVDGVCAGIIAAGEKLKQHFPYKKGDINELPDEISYDAG